jgi:hypothetical protein
MLKSLANVKEKAHGGPVLFPWDSTLISCGFHDRQFHASADARGVFSKNNQYGFTQDFFNHVQWRMRFNVDNYRVKERPLEHPKFAEDCYEILALIANTIWQDSRTGNCLQDLNGAVVALARITNAYFCDVEDKPHAGMTYPGGPCDAVVFDAEERKEVVKWIQENKHK